MPSLRAALARVGGCDLGRRGLQIDSEERREIGSPHREARDGLGGTADELGMVDATKREEQLRLFFETNSDAVEHRGDVRLLSFLFGPAINWRAAGACLQRA